MKIRHLILPGMSRAIVAWSAMLAVLMMALAPAVSVALQARSGQSSETFWMQICSDFSDRHAVSGTTADMADMADGSSGPEPHPQLANHCPYCVMHANLVMPVPGTGAVLVAPAQALYQVAPALFFQSRQVLFAWTVALSRAPPARLLPA